VGAQSKLWSIDASDYDSGILGVGGEDKTISVYDVWKWKLVGQWWKVTKYDITAIRFSRKYPSVIYACGLDQEIFCGAWHPSAQKFNTGTLRRNGLRGDGRWMGIQTIEESNEEILLGLTENGTFFSLQKPYTMVHETLLKTLNQKQLSTSTSTSSGHKKQSKKRKQAPTTVEEAVTTWDL